MATIGVMTTEFDEPTFVEVLDQITTHRLDCVQLQLGSVVESVATSDALLRGLDALGGKVDAELADQTHSLLVARGITVAAVDGTYNMVHPDPERRRRNLDRLIDLIGLAPAFGTRIVTLCTGSRADVMWQPSRDNRSEEAWLDLVTQLRPAAAAAEAAQVQLAFEPEYNNVVDSARQARRLMDEIGSPALKVLMDAANIFHRGDLGRMRDHLDDAFELVGQDIALAHAKDLDHDGDAGGRAAGRGRLDYQHYLALLSSYEFDGAIILHQMKELAPDGFGSAFDFVRDQAPDGYLR